VVLILVLGSALLLDKRALTDGYLLRDLLGFNPVHGFLH
jgi:hypothetical protein